MSLPKILPVAALAVLGGLPLAAQTLPALPDSSGWGTHVLTVQRDPAGAIWVGTYGRGIYRLRPGSDRWDVFRSDTTDTSISWDFVQAFGFGREGQIWYGTVGNGWGLSTDDGKTWRNWTFGQLGPEWQYVAPDGIAVHGDTVVIATADGLQVTTDDGIHWTALVDRTGPPAKGPADTAIVVLRNEYTTALVWEDDGLLVRSPAGWQRLRVQGGRWTGAPAGKPEVAARNRVTVGKTAYAGSPCGLRPVAELERPCLAVDAPPATPPERPRTTWFRRPIDPSDNAMIDQTYRYGSTMGGNFQQHQGVEFNNADGTPVHAIGAGVVEYAGPAEAGALTVAIRHDSTLVTGADTLAVYSVYYHNSSLLVHVGDRVKRGQVISRVGNTGRATNDHLHLEVHATPRDADVKLVVDSLERYPRYTTNPELWIAPLPGTGIVAGRVLNAAGEPTGQVRIYGLRKPEPVETPFSFVETYGSRAHPHPLYRETFAIGDVPPGEYTLGVEVEGRRIYRKVRVSPGRLTWVEFR